MDELKSCPFCGQPPHMDKHEIFCDCGAKIEFPLYQWGVSDKAREGFPTYEQAKECAIEAWNSRAEPPTKPLTLAQFTEIYSTRENHVWPFDALPPQLFLESAIEKNDFCWISWGVARTIFEQGYRAYSVDSYGKKWRCWTRKPTDEERRAAAWIN